MTEKISPNVYIGYAQYIASGLWLSFLYYVFLILVLFSLSIYQFQKEIENIPVDPSSLDLPEIFIDHKCNISSLKGLERNTSSIVDVPCIRRADADAKENYTASDILRNQVYNRSVYENKIKQSQDKIDSLNKEIQQVEDDNMKISILRGNLRRAQLDQDTYKKELLRIDSINASISKIEQDSRFYDSLFSQITNKVGIVHVWAIPSVLLSILLSLSMGGLGSLVTVTISYLKIKSTNAADVNYSMYVFRPMLGSIMALVVYISIKSGQMSFFGEMSSELSPFLLSFIGVLSGLLSEKFYRRFVKYGSNMVEDSK